MCMMMKKILFLAVAAMMATMTLTSCSKDDDNHSWVAPPAKEYF